VFKVEVAATNQDSDTGFGVENVGLAESYRQTSKCGALCRAADAITSIADRSLRGDLTDS
jgi:hypothetical protein